MLRIRIASHVSVLILTLALAACGGGGGGDGGSSAPAGPVASTHSFPFSMANANIINNGYTYNFSVSGTVDLAGATYGITGSGSATRSQAVAATFEGEPALQNTQTVTMTLTVNGVMAPPETAPQQIYSTSGYLPLGTTDGTYCLIRGPAAVPATVMVGDTAAIGTLDCYVDAAKTTLLGTSATSFVVEPDTADTVIVNLVQREYDPANVLQFTDESRWRIDTSGNVTFVSETATGDGLSLALRPSP